MTEIKTGFAAIPAGDVCSEAAAKYNLDLRQTAEAGYKRLPPPRAFKRL